MDAGSDFWCKRSFEYPCCDKDERLRGRALKENGARLWKFFFRLIKTNFLYCIYLFAFFLMFVRTQSLIMIIMIYIVLYYYYYYYI